MPQDADEPLQLDRCSHCGYRLIGLPSHGACPECGIGYVAGQIVLYGWAEGSKRKPYIARQRFIWDDAAHIFFLFIGFQIGPWVCAAVLLVDALQLAITTLRRRRLVASYGAPVQLWLSPQGLCQQIASPSPNYVSWHGVNMIKFTRNGRWLRIVLASKSSSKRPEVDFELECDEEKELRIERLIEDWIMPAREQRRAVQAVEPVKA